MSRTLQIAAEGSAFYSLNQEPWWKGDSWFVRTDPGQQPVSSHDATGDQIFTAAIRVNSVS